MEKVEFCVDNSIYSGTSGLVLVLHLKLKTEAINQRLQAPGSVS